MKSNNFLIDTLNEDTEEDPSSPPWPKIWNKPNASAEGELMIERNCHYCSHSSIENFKRLLRKNDVNMFFSPYLNFSITNEIQAQESIIDFIDQLNKIIASNNEVLKIMKLIKRSNSDHLQLRPFSRNRTNS